MIVYEALHFDVECPESVGVFFKEEDARAAVDNLEFHISDPGVFRNEVTLFLGDFLVRWGTPEEIETFQAEYNRWESDFFIAEIHIQ